jgi:hypothetical protein
MNIKTGKEIVQWTRSKSLSEMSVEPYNKRWVAVDDLINRIETICNHGKNRDMRFRNHLLRELEEPQTLKFKLKPL